MNVRDLKNLIKELESNPLVNDDTEVKVLTALESGGSTSWEVSDLLDIEFEEELEVSFEDTGCLIYKNVVVISCSGDTVGWE